MKITKQKSVISVAIILVISSIVWPSSRPLAPSPIRNIDNEALISGMAQPDYVARSELSLSQAHTLHKPNETEVQAATPQGLKVYPNRQYKALFAPPDQPTGQWYPNRVSAPETWELTTGSPDTTVAVIDTGFALQHVELFDRWALNSGESGGGKEANGVDDDSNGYIDDWRGWDFIQSDNAPNAGSINPTSVYVAHGSSVAGLVGAAGNNGIGVASINWQTRIMPLQALADNGFGDTAAVASAIYYAVDNGADVISMSLGSDFPDELVENAITYAANQNVLVVAAAGNDGCNCMAYPAAYPATLSVGATDKNDTVAWFSSYGADLDIVAPGSGSMYSPSWTVSNQQSSYSSALYGTSFSTPIVSGVAALVKAKDPTLTYGEVADILKLSADTVPDMSSPGQAIKYGAGRVNAYQAFRATTDDLTINQLQLLTPLYRLYKSGAEDVYTTEADDRDHYRFERGYQYEIVRFTQEY